MSQKWQGRAHLLQLWPLLGLLLWVTGPVKGHAEGDFYPIGIYGAGSVETLRLAKELGFNAVRAGLSEKLMETAASLDMKVFAKPGTQAGEGFSRQEALRAIIEYDDHPALWAWYLVDEPSLNRVSPAKVREAYDWLKYSGAEKPVSIVMYRSGRADAYREHTDMLMVDRYPVPWMPIANFSKHINNGRLAVGDDKPLIPILQCFDWKSGGSRFDLDIPLRAPNYREIRSMTYSALIHGADGLFYYSLHSGRWDIREHPGTLASLKTVVNEVRERLPLFRGEHQWWPQYEHFGERAHRFNAALDATIGSALVRVKSGSSVVPPGSYLVASNTTSQTIQYATTLPIRVAESVKVLGEERRISLEDGWARDQIGPYGVRVYGPFQQSDAAQPRNGKE